MYVSIDLEKTFYFSLHLVTQSTSTDFEDHLGHQTKELISHIHKAFKETLDVREILFHDFQKINFFYWIEFTVMSRYW